MGMDSWRGPRIPQLPGHSPETVIADTARNGAFVAAAGGHVATLYGCGITPYDATHLGHAATFIALDLLVRSWRDCGHDVRYVQNVSDVDDPLLERAAATGENWKQLAERETRGYCCDMESLRVIAPDHFIGAAEGLEAIEQLIQKLADRGALYEVGRDLYFAKSSDPQFGSLSGLSVASMIALFAERGGDPDRPGKKDALDPAVWVSARPGELAQDSAYGAGRPGWHVQCAGIASQYLGVTFDVQAGGSDLVFPHHEMSASLARVALATGAASEGPVFARRYLHTGMVGLDGAKMSKSKGNLVLVSTLLEAGTDPMAIRLAILASRYSEDWDWTSGLIAPAAERLARWRTAVRLLSAGRVPNPARIPSADSVLAAVRDRLADNLDAPGALAVVDEWARSVESAADGSGPAQSAGGSGVCGAGRFPEAATGIAAPGDVQVIRDTVDALLGVIL
jgi:L-cysteine:1D-myo-inositol 2-amino-2-deoxy-alpha-D-glucopyranoside ligase